MNKRINIIYISLVGITEKMLEAAAEGAREAGAEVRMIKADESRGVADFVECDAMIWGTGNYFGYMEGLLKHWYDLYQIPSKKECKKHDLPWRPYFICCSGGWNVTKPLTIMEYMHWGMRLKKVFEPETLIGKPTPEVLASCRERGRQLAEIDVDSVEDLYQPTERQLKALK